MATAETLSPSPFADPAFFDDPYPFIHRLRREDPVHLTPFGFWFVTRHDDVKRLFNDPGELHARPPRLGVLAAAARRAASSSGSRSTASSRRRPRSTRACASSSPPR